jgi:hypothetical protein
VRPDSRASTDPAGASGVRRGARAGTGLLVLVALLVGVASRPLARAADAPAWMFAPDVVVRIDLGLSDDALAALAVAPREYVPATFTMAYGERRYGPWAIQLKLKGLVGSFRPMAGKAAFKLKFPSGARPDGLKKMTLNNMVQDVSKVHEAVSYELFRAVDVAAPRTGYASVAVNGAPYGLYANVETLDAVGLARWYPATRHLYEGSYTPAENPADPFDAHYEVDEGDADDRGDLAALLAAAADRSPGWYARIAALADLGQMTRMWATETYVGQWDGYTSPIPNNYYLHADGAGRFTMLPWGTDQALVVRTGFYDETPLHLLFTGCLEDPICRALYDDALAAVAAVARSIALAKRPVTIERGIRSYVAADPKLEHAVSDARRALTATTRFLRARPTDFASWARTRPRPPRATTVSASAGTIAIHWTKPPGHARAAITGHAIEYRRDGKPWLRIDAAADATAAVISGLAAGTYEVRVRRLAGLAASIGVATRVVLEP